jgi:hypothetical protein
VARLSCRGGFSCAGELVGAVGRVVAAVRRREEAAQARRRRGESSGATEGGPPYSRLLAAASALQDTVAAWEYGMQAKERAARTARQLAGPPSQGGGGSGGRAREGRPLGHSLFGNQGGQDRGKEPGGEGRDWGQAGGGVREAVPQEGPAGRSSESGQEVRAGGGRGLRVHFDVAGTQGEEQGERHGGDAEEERGQRGGGQGDAGRPEGEASKVQERRGGGPVAGLHPERGPREQQEERLGEEGGHCGQRAEGTRAGEGARTADKMMEQAQEGEAGGGGQPQGLGVSRAKDTEETPGSRDPAAVREEGRGGAAGCVGWAAACFGKLVDTVVEEYGKESRQRGQARAEVGGDKDDGTPGTPEISWAECPAAEARKAGGGAVDSILEMVTATNRRLQAGLAHMTKGDTKQLCTICEDLQGRTLEKEEENQCNRGQLVRTLCLGPVRDVVKTHDARIA